MGKNISIGLISEEWAMEFNSKGFKIVDQGTSDNGDSTHVHAVQEKTGINISIYLEPARMDGTIIECRDFYWSRAKESPFKKNDIMMKETKDMAIVEYITPEHEGRRIDHKNINAYMVKDLTWIDIHISKALFKEKDLKALYSLLESVKFIKKDLDPSYLLFIMANKNFQENNYPEAIKYYFSFLQREMKNKNSRIPFHYLRVAIDNVGMALGISGELEQSKKAFEMGLTIDPEYPLFYYNLACTYAEMNDLDNAISNLESCLKHADNLHQGEFMPDPNSDDSFQRFIENERFMEVARKFSL